MSSDCVHVKDCKVISLVSSYIITMANNVEALHGTLLTGIVNNENVHLLRRRVRIDLKIIKN